MTQTHVTATSEELIWRGELALQRIVKLKEDLAMVMARTDEVRLHLVDVSEVDVAFLQLLCSAHRSATAQGKTLQLVGQLPGAFLEIMQLAGLNRHVGCSHDCDGSCLWKHAAVVD